ncbi:hypothetical protein JVU11DRAFT_6036 [Chiua virens]|nr:hypothetical protein JVU11DRAFT_6036 [Chiua virens]
MLPHAQRKYIDLIRYASSKWVNWNPLTEIRVGAYGTFSNETGDFITEGNVYDPDFQGVLDKQGIKFIMADHPPVEGPIEDDFIVASRGVKRSDLNVEDKVDVADVANASLKGEWTFQNGKRDALFIMHRPRQVSIPPNMVLGPLYEVDMLIRKWLVTSVNVCPAYSMYLSNKSGERVSLALVAETPVQTATGVTADAKSGFHWWTDAQTGLLRNACDEAGNYAFKPLYSLRYPIKRVRRFFRDKIRPEPTGDDLWYNESPPWEPLDEDGEEDPIDDELKAVDPFKELEAEARAQGRVV